MEDMIKNTKIGGLPWNIVSFAKKIIKEYGQHGQIINHFSIS